MDMLSTFTKKFGGQGWPNYWEMFVQDPTDILSWFIGETMKLYSVYCCGFRLIPKHKVDSSLGVSNITSDIFQIIIIVRYFCFLDITSESSTCEEPLTFCQREFRKSHFLQDTTRE